MRRLSMREHIYNFITCVAIVTICWWINMLQIMDHLMIEILISVPRAITTEYSAETFNFNFITLGHFFFIKGTFFKCLSHSIWLTGRHDTIRLYTQHAFTRLAYSFVSMSVVKPWLLMHTFSDKINFKKALYF